MPELLTLTVALVPLAVVTSIARTTPLLPPLNLTRPRVMSRWERRHTRSTEKGQTR